MKKQGFDYIALKIKKDLLFELLLMTIILYISITSIANINPLFAGTSYSFIPINNKVVFLSIYFLLILLAFVRIVYVIFKIKKLKYEFYARKKVKRLYFINDAISFTTKILVIFSFTLAFLFTITTVNGDSMNGSLFNGDKVLVWHFNKQYQKQDIVIVHLEEQAQPFLLKRIKGTSGDKIGILPSEGRNGLCKLMINDVYVADIENSDWHYNLLEQYKDYKNITSITPGSQYPIYEFIIPENKFFVLGDNVNNSIDSRKFGLVQSPNVIGKVIFILSPFRNIGTPPTF